MLRAVQDAVMRFRDRVAEFQYELQNRDAALPALLVGPNPHYFAGISLEPRDTHVLPVAPD
jgi:hypothetical protein